LNRSAWDDCNLEEDEYAVEQLYKGEGCCQAMARSSAFIYTTLLIIAFNAVYLGLETEFNNEMLTASGRMVFAIVDNLFCVFFVFELLIRFGAFDIKWSCLRDSWFIFDAFLVIFGVIETWIAPLVLFMTGSESALKSADFLRLLRLLRLSRLVRIVRNCSELVTMVKGMRVASRAVASSLLMVGLITYAFAIIVCLLLKEEKSLESMFSTLPLTIWSLTIHCTLLDNIAQFLTQVRDIGTFNSTCGLCLIALFILLAAITVMNMLIGVLCEVVSAVSTMERDEAAVSLIKESVLVMLRKCDSNGNGLIAQDELSSLMDDIDSVGALESLHIDVGHLELMQELLFDTPFSEVPARMIMEQMLFMRGNLPVTVKHLLDMNAYTKFGLEKKLADLEIKLLTAIRDANNDALLT
jgi:hypothetical protein